MFEGQAVVEYEAEVAAEIEAIAAGALDMTGPSTLEADYGRMHLTVESEWICEAGLPARRGWGWSIWIRFEGDFVALDGGMQELYALDLRVPARRLAELVDKYWGWSTQDVVEDVAGWTVAGR